MQFLIFYFKFYFLISKKATFQFSVHNSFYLESPQDKIQHATLCRFAFWSEPPKWLFFGINQNKLTQGVKPYKKEKKKKILAPPKFAVSNFRQSGPKNFFFFLNPLTRKFNVGHKCNFFLYDLLFLIFFRIKRKNFQKSHFG